MTEEIKRLSNLIQSSSRIVFFGGAGVSTESQIPDFRSDEGLYGDKQAKQYPYPPETMLSHSFFKKHTEQFFEYYFDKMVYPEAKPNPAHLALAKLEQMGELSAVITQNIDGLHQMAGSRRVCELHGSVHRNFCMNCGKKYTLKEMLAFEGKGVPTCSCGGIIKPDVVLYEEALDNDVMAGAISYIMAADLMIVGGTSLAVYPAAGLLQYYSGKELVLINQTPTSYDRRASRSSATKSERFCRRQWTTCKNPHEFPIFCLTLLCEDSKMKGNFNRRKEIGNYESQNSKTQRICHQPRENR